VTPTGRPLIGDGTSPILLSDGRVLFIGNTFEGPAGTIVSISSEVYDPEAGTFSLAPGTSRRAFTATPLLDGRVLVVGGAPGSEFSATSGSAEIFQ
jgi:hypothetical protein